MPNWWHFFPALVTAKLQVRPWSSQTAEAHVTLKGRRRKVATSPVSSTLNTSIEGEEMDRTSSHIWVPHLWILPHSDLLCTAHEPRIHLYPVSEFIMNQEIPRLVPWNVLVLFIRHWIVDCDLVSFNHGGSPRETGQRSIKRSMMGTYPGSNSGQGHLAISTKM